MDGRGESVGKGKGARDGAEGKERAQAIDEGGGVGKEEAW